MDHLPNELILEIIGYLSCKDVHHALSISLVNRRFHDLANEIIYNTFSMARQDPALFLRSLVSSSDLGKYIKHLNWAEHTAKCQGSVKKLTDADYHQLENRLAEVRNSTDAYCGFLRISHLQDDLSLDTILCFTPRVEAITLTLRIQQHRPVSFKALALHPSLFINLRQMIVRGPMRIWDVLPLFTVPSLRSLSLAKIQINRNRPQNCEDDSESFLSRLAEEGSYIENFQVVDCYTDSKKIVKLLEFFVSLKSFDFKLFEGRYGPDGVVEFGTVLRGLLNQHNSLESLCLRDYRLVEAGALEVLKDCRHLRRLDLNVPTFFSDHTLIVEPNSLSAFLRHLPNTLQELTLRINDEDGADGQGPSKGVADVLEVLAPTFPEMFPALTKLIIAEWDPLLGIFPCQTQLQSLQLAFADTGIEFVSRPHSSLSMNTDVYALDYIEEGWLWVQAITEDGKWVKDISRGEHLVNMEIWDFKAPGPGDWVEVNKDEMSENDSDAEGLNEYTAEQPVWYWNKLHADGLGSRI
jgi:metal-responsive CopG/Arc/MetJ family transcriptional regulator